MATEQVRLTFVVDVDCRAAFYAFGTSRLPVGTKCRTVFGR